MVSWWIDFSRCPWAVFLKNILRQEEAQLAKHLNTFRALSLENKNINMVIKLIILKNPKTN